MPRSRAAAKYDIGADDKTKPAVKSVISGFNKINSAASLVKGSFAAITALAPVAAFTALYKSQAPVVDRLGKVADKLGLTTNALQALRDAGERAGIGTQAVDVGLQRMTRRLADAAQGSGEAVKALDQLNLSAADLVKLNADQQFLAISDALEQIDNQSEKVRLSFKFFDSEGVDLFKILRTDVESAADEMDRLGISLNRVDVAQVEAANNELQIVGRNVQGVAQQFVSQLSPAVTAAVNTMFDLGSATFNVRDSFQAFASGAVTFVGGVGDIVTSIQQSFLALDLGVSRVAVKLAEFEAFLKGEESTPRLDRLKRELAEVENALGSLLAAAPFSQVIETEYLKAQIAAREYAKAVEEAQAKQKDFVIPGVGQAATTSGTSSSDREDAVREAREKKLIESLRNEQEAKRAATEEGFRVVQESLRSETQIIIDEFKKRQEAVSLYEALPQADRAAANDARVALELALEDRLLALKKQKTDEHIADERRRQDSVVSHIKDFAGIAVGLLQKDVGQRIEINERMTAAEKQAAEQQNAINKKKFEDNKKYQRAAAIGNTLLGVTLALSRNDFATAAKVGLQGFAAVAQLESLKFGGGNASSLSTGGGGGVVNSNENRVFQNSNKVVFVNYDNKQQAFDDYNQLRGDLREVLDDDLALDANYEMSDIMLTARSSRQRA